MHWLLPRPPEGDGGRHQDDSDGGSDGGAGGSDSGDDGDAAPPAVPAWAVPAAGAGRLSAAPAVATYTAVRVAADDPALSRILLTWSLGTSHLPSAYEAALAGLRLPDAEGPAAPAATTSAPSRDGRAAGG